MIGKIPHQTKRSLFVSAVAVSILMVTLCVPFAADAPRDAAVQKSVNAWLVVIDEVQYAKSWDEASKLFQTAISSKDWVKALDSARKPLGKCLKREQASLAYQKDVPANGKVLKGEFAILQFKSSFANLASAVETVTFEKASDGTWRAAGYFIRPN